MDYEKKYKEAQKWMESIYSELSHEQQMEAEAFFPELKESEDEKIRKEIINIFHSLADGKIPVPINFADIFTWLEKQGEQKPIKMWHDISEVPDEMQELLVEWESPDATWHDIAFYDAETKAFRHLKQPINNVTRWAYVSDILSQSVTKTSEQGWGDALERQGEQKPASKVEPKFKVGDWVVCEAGELTSTLQITGIKNGYYWFHDDTYLPVVDEDCLHLWTIQDANDGDVLVCPIPKTYDSARQIFMFKGINSRTYVDNCIEFYCRVHKGVFYENENGNGYMGTTSSPIYPATKEQRDTLFAKMKEAGYEWDAEKKELKKISQRMISAEAKEAMYDKHTDNDMVEALRTEYEKGRADAFAEMEKPAWSEEDEDAIGMAIIALEDMYDEDAPNTTYGGYNLPFNKAAERLKSLKNRMKIVFAKNK